MGSWVSKPQVQVLLLGLDNAGKSTLLYKLKHNTCVSTVPTIGFNVEMLEARKNRKKISITIWDVGGQGKMRDHWPNFYQNTGAVVFVLERTLRNDELRGRPLILLANKQDVDGALNVTEMKDRFNMRKICQERDCFVQPCSASTGFGVEEAFKRVVQVVKLSSEPGAVKDNIRDTVHYLRTNSKQ
ncbi:phosphatidylinositol 4-kinase B [Sarotherodon galilaeus]